MILVTIRFSWEIKSVDAVFTNGSIGSSVGLGATKLTDLSKEAMLQAIIDQDMRFLSVSRGIYMGIMWVVIYFKFLLVILNLAGLLYCILFEVCCIVQSAPIHKDSFISNINNKSFSYLICSFMRIKFFSNGPSDKITSLGPVLSIQKLTVSLLTVFEKTKYNISLSLYCQYITWNIYCVLLYFLSAYHPLLSSICCCLLLAICSFSVLESWEL